MFSVASFPTLLRSPPSFRLLRQSFITSTARFITSSIRPGCLTGCCVALLLSPSAYAHEFWLVPHDGITHEGKRVVFELRIGPTWPGVQTPRIPDLVSWFQARDVEGTREVDGREGALAVGNITARAPGSLVVAMRTNSASTELPGDEFNQYLEEEGLNNVLALREKFGLMDAPGHEIFSRCAKSIILVDEQSQGYDQQMDLPLELVPRTDPLHASTQVPLDLQLLFHGQPLAGALVKAQLKADPVVELTARSNAQGMVSFDLMEPGLWLFNAVHMEPSGDDSADWESLWSSLTIDLTDQFDQVN